MTLLTALDFPVAQFLTLWYMVDVGLLLATYVHLVRRKEEILSSALRSTWLVFIIIGVATLFLISTVAFIWAMYAKSPKDLRNKVAVGVAVAFFITDCPFFVMNLYLYLSHGIFDWLQALTLLFNFISWFIGLLIVWTMWMWRCAKILQRWSGDPLYPSHAPPVPGMQLAVI